ncbi:hypothetical protein FKP32DRAFT_15753 [Trametes sanguinea]|nr:hypothetical protein FKP32DRAFT_15753 [Trametes sanguinea]
MGISEPNRIPFPHVQLLARAGPCPLLNARPVPARSSAQLTRSSHSAPYVPRTHPFTPPRPRGPPASVALFSIRTPSPHGARTLREETESLPGHNARHPEPSLENDAKQCPARPSPPSSTLPGRYVRLARPPAHLQPRRGAARYLTLAPETLLDRARVSHPSRSPTLALRFVPQHSTSHRSDPRLSFTHSAQPSEPTPSQARPRAVREPPANASELRCAASHHITVCGLCRRFVAIRTYVLYSTVLYTASAPLSRTPIFKPFSCIKARASVPAGNARHAIDALPFFCRI